MRPQFGLALTCCLLTGCNTGQSPSLTQRALVGEYVYRSVDTSVDKPTDHQFDHLTLKGNGTYELVQGDQQRPGLKKPASGTSSQAIPPMSS